MRALTTISHYVLAFLLLTTWCSCLSDQDDLTPTNGGGNGNPMIEDMPCDSLVFTYNSEEGCDGQIYNDPATSPYIIPLNVEEEFSMGLCNCSSSFHASGNPDEYAFDFDLATGTVFIAARGGTVVKMVEDQNSFGGGVGNLVIIDHLDGTYGHYLHSPKDGIYVEEGQAVSQGMELGEIGSSGLAGYPHLHFIVTSDGYDWPYQGVPVSFNNVVPPTVVLETNATYTICQQ